MKAIKKVLSLQRDQMIPVAGRTAVKKTLSIVQPPEVYSLSPTASLIYRNFLFEQILQWLWWIPLLMDQLKFFTGAVSWRIIVMVASIIIWLSSWTECTDGCHRRSFC